MQNALMVELARVITCILPKNITGAAQTGPWIQMGQGQRCLFILNQGAWAGGNAAVTLGQATTNAGGSAKALAFAKRWYNDTKTVAQTGDIPTAAAVTSSTFDLATANQCSMIEINASDLDNNNGFQYVRLETATPGTNADLLSAIAIVYDLRDMGDPTKMVSVLG